MSGHLAQLGKHSAVLLVGNILSRGLGFFLVPLYTHELLPSEFSHWESLILMSTLVSMVSAHGLTAALMWTLKTGGASFSEEPQGEDRQRVVSAAVGWAMVAATVICGLGILAAVPLAWFTTDSGGYGLAMVLLLVAQGLRVVTWPAEGVLKLRFQSVAIVQMSFGEFLVQGLGTVVALVVLDMGLVGMAWANALAAVLRFGLGLRYLPEMRRPRFDLAIVGPMVRYGLPLMPGAIAALVLSLSDRVFFNQMGMDTEGGLYAYGDKWARMVEFLLITPLVGMWPAVFFNIARDDDAKAQFARIATLFAGTAGALGFAITMVGPLLTATFDTSAENAFDGAAGPIGVLTVGYVFWGLNEVARVGFQVTGRTRRTALAMVLAAVLNLGLNAVFIPRFGALGAAWATLTAYAAAVIFSLLLSRTIYPQRWEYMRLFHVAGVFVGGAWVVHLAGVPVAGPAAWALRIALALAAPLALLATGFLSRDERRRLVAMLRSRLPGGAPRVS